MKKDWVRVRLGDICTKITDGSHNPPKGIELSDYRMLSSKNVFDGEITFESPRYLSETDFVAENKRTDVQVGDVLLTIVGTVGRVAVVPVGMPKFTLQRSVAVLKPNKSLIDSRFLMFSLQDIIDEMNESARGVAQKGLYLGQIKEIGIYLPQLDKQKRIVAILDETFEGISTAAATAEKNLANAREIFESEVEYILSKRGEAWIDQTLDQVCLVERGSSPRPIKEFFTTDHDGVNWIKIGDTEEGGKYVYSTAQKITPEGAKQSRFVKEGDFILTNSMSYGRPYIMKTDGYIHDGWFVLRLKTEIDTDFFYYLLSSNFVQSQFSRLASGSVVKNISGDLVKMTRLPIPPLDQQHHIVKKLVRLSEETQRLEANYQQKLAALAELKKSILHRAFSGQLH